MTNAKIDNESNVSEILSQLRKYLVVTKMADRFYIILTEI